MTDERQSGTSGASAGGPETGGAKTGGSEPEGSQSGGAASSWPDLASAPWTRRPSLARLVEALGAQDMRWVGGAVRDGLLGEPVEDVDCATRHLPEEVIKRCQAHGIRTVPTGIEHGTVTALLDGGPVEITTLRRDVSTDGRRATVAYAQEWREDAARRDFTINALYAHPETLEISDYFGGLDDLRDRRVRFIGDPQVRIAEDHLRILRYFRFQARFGAVLDEEAEAACARMAPSLLGLSRERIAMELLALLSLPDPAPTIARMHRLGVLQVILPEAVPATIERLGALIEHERAAGIEGEAIRRLGALIPAHRESAEQIAARLRLSRAQRARLVCIAEASEEPANGPAQAPRALAYRLGRECAIDRLLIAGGDPGDIRDWDIPRLPLSGGEIVARGVGEGPLVSKLLRRIEQRWIEEGFPDRLVVLAMLDEELARLKGGD